MNTKQKVVVTVVVLGIVAVIGYSVYQAYGLEKLSWPAAVGGTADSRGAAAPLNPNVETRPAGETGNNWLTGSPTLVPQNTHS